MHTITTIPSQTSTNPGPTRTEVGIDERHARRVRRAIRRRSSTAATSTEIAGHGAFGMPDGCFLRIRPGNRVFTVGVGVGLLDMIRHPLDGGRVLDLGRAS